MPYRTRARQPDEVPLEFYRPRSFAWHQHRKPLNIDKLRLCPNMSLGCRSAEYRPTEPLNRFNYPAVFRRYPDNPLTCLSWSPLIPRQDRIAKYAIVNRQTKTTSGGQGDHAIHEATEASKTITPPSVPTTRETSLPKLVIGADGHDEHVQLANCPQAAQPYTSYDNETRQACEHVSSLHSCRPAAPQIDQKTIRNGHQGQERNRRNQIYTSGTPRNSCAIVGLRNQPHHYE